MSLAIGDYFFDSFGAVTIKQQCDGIGLSGVATAQLTVSVTTAEYEAKKPKSNALVRFIVKKDDLRKEYIFWVASRRKSGGKVDFVCYDRMAFSDAYVDEEKLSYNEDVITAVDLVTAIAGLCGIENIDSSITTIGYFGSLPFKKEDIANKTARTLLDEISKAWCGYFKITYENTLCFISFNKEAITGLVTEQHTAIVTGNEKGPITKIEVHGDEQFTAGNKDADAFETIKISTKFASQELADALLARIQGATYEGWNCSKAIIPVETIPDITAIMQFKGDPSGVIRYANNATITFNATNVYFSGGANETTENEFEYVGALSRKIEERIKDGEKLGNNTMVTRYQGLIHLAPKEVSAQSSTTDVKQYGYSPADINGVVEFDGAMVSSIVPTSASINDDKTEAVVEYGSKKYKYSIEWSGNNITSFTKEEITE